MTTEPEPGPASPRREPAPTADPPRALRASAPTTAGPGRDQAGPTRTPSPGPAPGPADTTVKRSLRDRLRRRTGRTGTPGPTLSGPEPTTEPTPAPGPRALIAETGPIEPATPSVKRPLKVVAGPPRKTEPEPAAPARARKSPGPGMWALIIVTGLLLGIVLVSPTIMSSQDIYHWAMDKQNGLGLTHGWALFAIGSLDAVALVCVLMTVIATWLRNEPPGIFRLLIFAFAAGSAFANYTFASGPDRPASGIWFFPAMSVAGPLVIEFVLNRVRRWLQQDAGTRSGSRVSFPITDWMPIAGSFKETFLAWRLSGFLPCETADAARSAYAALCPDGSWKVLTRLREERRRALDAAGVIIIPGLVPDWMRPTEPEPEPDVIEAGEPAPQLTAGPGPIEGEFLALIEALKRNDPPARIERAPEPEPVRAPTNGHGPGLVPNPEPVTIRPPRRRYEPGPDRARQIEPARREPIRIEPEPEPHHEPEPNTGPGPVATHNAPDAQITVCGIVVRRSVLTLVASQSASARTADDLVKLLVKHQARLAEIERRYGINEAGQNWLTCEPAIRKSQVSGLCTGADGGKNQGEILACLTVLRAAIASHSAPPEGDQ